MRTKIPSILICLLISMTMFVVVDLTIEFSPTAGGATIYVPTDYPTIQEAINNAIDGDTIYVYNGTYNENVLVNKIVNLIGEDKNVTIIDGGGNGDVINVSSDWVNILGFTVTGGGGSAESPGIRLHNVKNCIITNNNVLYNTNGIYLHNSNGNNITNNNVSHSYWGIFLYHSCANNIIDNNIFDNFYGISLESSSNNNITGNNISYNWLGISLESSLNGNITKNTFTNDGILISGTHLSHSNSHNIPTNNIVNGKPLYYYKDCSGINIDGIPVGQLILANCTNVDVRNLLINHTSAGIELAFSTNVNIIGNTLSYNYYGIYLWYSSNNNITGNIVVNGNNGGISLWYSSNNNAIDNDLLNNHIDGIRLYSSSNNNIIGNNASLNYFYGIYLPRSSDKNLITGNNVSLNYRRGIYLEWSNNNNLITSNNVSSNNVDGIWIRSSSNNTVIDNNVHSNIDCGFILSSSSSGNLIISNNISNNRKGILLDTCGNNNLITGNNISNNNDGIYFDRSSDDNTVTCNDVSSNDRYGIYIQLSSKNDIIGNYVSSNDWTGILLKESSNDNLIAGNNVSNNGDGIYLQESLNNSIYHNNIINNTNQAYDDTNNGNQWDNGYPSGGNYWSDFDEPSELAFDEYKGADQNVLGSDGIVDNGSIAGGGKNPYVIDSDSQDYYPLIGPYKNYMILKQGWNLISIPLIQQEQNLTKVLNSTNGLYDAVQWYDITDSVDPWKHYKPGKPFGNDLFQINETIGFWIHIIPPGDTIFYYNGVAPTQNQKITLYPGWNLVGYPSLSNKNRTLALNNINFSIDVDSIWTYDASTQKWKEIGSSDYLEIGRGYWIHSKVNKVWNVPL